MIVEVNALQKGEIISSSLLSIIKPLIYSHTIQCIKEQDVSSSSSIIKTIENDKGEKREETEENDVISLEGEHLLVLTTTNLLLLSNNNSIEEDTASHVIEFNLPLSSISRVNLLVSENQENEKSPIVNIHFFTSKSIYFYVEYAIFIVNEILKRLGGCWSVCFPTY